MTYPNFFNLEFSTNGISTQKEANFKQSYEGDQTNQKIQFKQKSNYS